MPTSWYQAIPNILTQVKLLDPKSILDIGVGFGKYGLLFRDILEIPYTRYEKKDWKVKIDGVEAFEFYRNPVYDFAYDKVYFGNILELIDTLPNYDCITLIDVIEHFSKEDGLQLISKLISHCNKGVIVSTPFYPDPQTDYLGNQFEQHKSVWSIVDFEHFNFTYERIEIEKNGAHIFNFTRNGLYKKMPFDELGVGCNKDTKKPLCIAYLLPHKNLTGGVKMLLQQMKYLKQRGHKIIACLKEENKEEIIKIQEKIGQKEREEREEKELKENKEKKQSVIPSWFDLEIDEEIIVPDNEPFLQHVPECDIIVAGWITQLIELSDSHIPVVYWEQGSEWLFGDITNQRHTQAVTKILEQCYLTKHAVLSVSPYVANTIFARYGRKTPVLSNGIDSHFYCTGEKSNTNKILLIGNPYLPFKGFDFAFKALALAWAAGYRFHVEWVCQTIPRIPQMPFQISPIIQPTQEELVKSYQNADVHLFTSWYEGFGMPPLEAMSCGTAVVCTKCGGIDSFVKNGYNALVSSAGDVRSLAVNIIALLKMPQLREMLALNGRKTAENLDYSNVILDLEAYLYEITL